MKKTLTLIIGFILFLSGMYALALSLESVQFAPIAFIEEWGRGVAFFIKLMMVMVGALLIFLASTKESKAVEQ